MKWTYKTSFLLVATSLTLLASPSEFEQFKQQRQQQLQGYTLQQQAEFAQYKQAIRDEFEAYKSKVTKVWGYAEVPTNKKLVVYSDDMQQKVVIDYETNDVQISAKDPQQIDKANQLLQQVLTTPASAIQLDLSGQLASSQQLLSSNGITVAQTLGLTADSVKQISTAVTTAPKRDEREQLDALLKDIEQLQLKVDKVVKAKETTLAQKQQEQQYLKKLEMEKQQILNKQAELASQPAKVKPATKRIKLNPNRWQRTKPYRQQVAKQAKKYQLPMPLLFAIMETESSFNPQAQSPIPAFGLMQVVPTSAGVDVNHTLYKHKRPPKKQSLFEPTTNVLYGATYMDLLMNRYFKGVTSDVSRLYVAVAAYNTGPGNVSRLFDPSGGKSLKKAAKQINRMTEQQVYQRIADNAHPETQGYIRKVTKAMNYYQGYAE